jgi:hypothetical protein
VSRDLQISVYEVVGSPLCVASDDGQKVYDRVSGALRQGRKVNLSFRNVSSLTSAFLNAAVGQLYGEFSEEEVRANLGVTDISQDDLALLKRVVDTAKEYFKDPARLELARRAVMEEGEDE